MKQYGVESIPNIVVLDPAGKRLGGFIGYQAPADFIKSLTPLIPKRRHSTAHGR